MALDTTAFDAGLQQHYEEKRKVRDLVERNNPFLGLVRKMENVGGNGIKTPLMFRNPTGGSATFSTAQSNTQPGGYDAFLQTHKEHYQTADISHKVLKLSSYREAFFSARKEIDRAINQVANTVSRKVFGDTGGSFARMSNSSYATTGLTLVRPEDAYHFEKNEVLKLSANKDGSSAKSGTLTISSINRQTGTLTLTGNISAGVATAAQNDYIFKSGDQALGWTGLESFNPVEASDLTTLAGIDQTEDSRLGGVRIDATGMTVEEACIELAAQLSFEGARPSHAFVNPIRFKDLALSHQANRVGRRDVKSQSGYISYNAFTQMGPTGEILILQDTSCAPSEVRMVEMDTLCLKSADSIPHIAKEDGVMLLRKASSMDYEVRLVALGDLTCDAPGYLGVAKLSATSA